MFNGRALQRCGEYSGKPTKYRETLGLIAVATSSLRMGQGERGYGKLQRPIAMERS